MKENKKCPYCGSMQVHKIKKICINSKKFIHFNVIWLPLTVCLYYFYNKIDKLPQALIGGIIGESFAILFLHIKKKNNTFHCDNCNTNFDIE